MRVEKGFETIWAVSALIHGHIRAAFAWWIYLVLIDELIKEKKKNEYSNTRKRVSKFFIRNNIAAREIKNFDRIIRYDIQDLLMNEIKSSEYVIDSLEASLLEDTNYGKLYVIFTYQDCSLF